MELANLLIGAGLGVSFLQGYSASSPTSSKNQEQAEEKNERSARSYADLLIANCLLNFSTVELASNVVSLVGNVMVPLPCRFIVFLPPFLLTMACIGENFEITRSFSTQAKIFLQKHNETICLVASVVSCLALIILGNASIGGAALAFIAVSVIYRQIKDQGFWELAQRISPYLLAIFGPSLARAASTAISALFDSIMRRNQAGSQLRNSCELPMYHQPREDTNRASLVSPQPAIDSSSAAASSLVEEFLEADKKSSQAEEIVVIEADSPQDHASQWVDEFTANQREKELWVQEYFARIQTSSQSVIPRPVLARARL